MEPIPRRNWIAVMGGLIGAFMAILDIQITNASLKDIQGALSATLSESSWISTSYLVAEMIAIPLSGWLSRGLSVRRYLLWTKGAFNPVPSCRTLNRRCSTPILAQRRRSISHSRVWVVCRISCFDFPVFRQAY